MLRNPIACLHLGPGIPVSFQLRQRFSFRGPKSVLEKGMTAAKMVAAYEQLYAEIIKKTIS